MKTNASIKYMTEIGILTSIATVLMLLEVPLWFVPAMYELDFSEVPILIGGFALGPAAAVLMELLKNLLNILINGTDTVFVGEFANFVTGCAFVLPATLIYKYKKTLKSAVWGLVLGGVTLVFAGSLMNAYVLIPSYCSLYGVPVEAIIESGTKVNRFIKDMPTFIAFGVAPFNLIKAVSCSALTLLLYKRLSKILHI